MRLPFLSECYPAHQDPHSFPTRRSSDLTEAIEQWTNVLGLTTAPTMTDTGVPLGTHQATRQRWEGACGEDRKSTRLNSSHLVISYAVFCLKKKRALYNDLVFYTRWSSYK